MLKYNVKIMFENNIDESFLSYVAVMLKYNVKITLMIFFICCYNVEE